MLGRPSEEGAGTGAELWRTVVRRLTWAAVVSNGLGALALFLLLGFLLPFAPDEPERQLWLNTAVGAAYLGVTLVLGTWWGARMSAPVEQWLVEERPPTAEERLRALGIPFRFAAVSGVFWVLGAILLAAINIPTSGWAALVLGGAIVLGGETTCAIGYLLVERIVRPVTALALAGGPPPARCVPGVRGRLTMAWSLGTGIPLLGILVIATAGLVDMPNDPEFLAAAVAFLGAVGLLVGMFAMSVASRSVAEPLAAVRDGIARIEEGDFDVEVPVDDGSEVGLLEAGFNRMAAGLRERERLRDLFGRHVGREVAEAALERDGVELGGELREVGAVFVDILGSTALAARRPPREVVAALNGFFRIVVDEVEVHGGWVNKFEGDAALCVFGAPTRRPDAACDALRAARLLHERLRSELPDVDAGIGVSAGAAVAGNVGTEERYEYTVIGDPVNEAARLCELAKRRPERVLASAAVVERSGAEEGRSLPGYKEPATVRTFDAPEALDTRFYEVRAKSALNKVPNASRMPFRWTINPYRGCAHACTYCARGDTEILMANGQTRPLADIRPGDRIYGTVRIDQYRRYVATEVLDHWPTVKPAYRVVLEDGTEIVCSGDHRFWTARGKWKHVTGTEQGRFRRPHLTLNDKLMGVGRFAAGPNHDANYRAGYLCGMIRGDGHVDSREYARPNGRTWTHHFFRLALVDMEALRRTRAYLEAIEVATKEFLFAAAAGWNEEINALRTQRRDHVEAIGEVIRFPRWPSTDWRKGFLAGIYDAEGSYGGYRVLRISNTDPELIDRTRRYLLDLGFDVAVDGPSGKSGVMQVRIRGGICEHLRFFHTVDPAISRKRSIEDAMIKSNAKLRVVAIEPLGLEIPLYDITTRSGDFISNGVISHNCFARPTHTYLDMNAGRDFEKEIVVKVNVPEVARAQLMKPSWTREHVALGTNTDPYQWVEGRYRLMPGIWEAMRDSGTPSSVLTKSPLLLRDIDLMKEVHAAAGFAANLSIPTLDEKAWRASEPHTPHPRKRIEAVAELNRAGIPTGVLIAPLMPGINDSPKQVEEILELCGEAGAVNIGGIPLHLRGEVREIFFEWLKSYRPDLVPRYERLYARGAYVGKEERERIQGLVRGGGVRAARRSTPETDPVTVPAARTARPPAQTRLF